MRAVVITEYGGPEVLTLAEVPDPEPGPEEILVRVAHTACNRADTLQRMGGYRDPVQREHEIPGLEYAGTVEAVGGRVTGWVVGDRVMGIESGACYAELLTTHERQALAVPSGIDLVDAAAIPEVFITAWDALVRQGGLASGRWALVHAGASGVGTAAIQIAKAVGARIAVTVSAGKMDACRALGADLVIERSPHDWAADLSAAVPGGVDVILDVIGGDETNRNLASIRPEGTIVQVGLMGGGQTAINLGLVLMKRIHLVGTTLRARPIEQKVAICRRFAAEMLPRFESGDLRPVIDSRFPIDRVADAHRHMEANANIGKILLDL
jgi:NADPH2:quinone reductase